MQKWTGNRGERRERSRNFLARFARNSDSGIRGGGDEEGREPHIRIERKWRKKMEEVLKKFRRSAAGSDRIEFHSILKGRKEKQKQRFHVEHEKQLTR